MEVAPEPTVVLDDARKHLKELAPLAAELNRASDAFTEELRVIEKELAQLNLGVEVELEEPLTTSAQMDDTDPDTGGIRGAYYREHHLAYGRDGGRWGLYVRTYRVDIDPTRRDQQGGPEVRVILEPPSRSLIDCSRELRMAAAEHVGKLLESVKEEATRKLEALRKVTDKRKPEKS